MEYEITLVAGVNLPDHIDPTSVGISLDDDGRLIITSDGEAIAGHKAVSYLFLEDTIEPEEEWIEEGFSDHSRS